VRVGERERVRERESFLKFYHLPITIYQLPFTYPIQKKISIKKFQNLFTLTP